MVPRYRYMCRYLVLLVVALLVPSLTTYAQTTVTGTIHDLNGNPYANGTASAIQVVATGQPQGVPTNVSTTSAGFFTIPLAAGTYQFTVCAAPVNLAPTNNPTPKQVCFVSGPI